MLASTLALAAVRSALLFGAALAAMRLLRRASAATRRLVLVGSVVAVLAVPFVSAVLPPLHVALADVSIRRTTVVSAEAPPEPIASSAVHAEPGGTAPQAQQSALPPRPWLAAPSTLVLAVWALGALAVIARLASGLARARKLARSAELVSRERLGSLRVEVRVSAAIEAPAVTGVFTPVVLLPREALSWSEEKRHLVLLHELAHVDRRDGLASFGAQLACALHWFNPLAWLVARRLRFERELAADDRVLASGARPSSYAEHLLAIATAPGSRSEVPSVALGMAQRSDLEARIIALLSSEISRAPLGRARAIILGLCASTLAVAVACATPESATSPDALTHEALSVSPVRHGGPPLDAASRADSAFDPALQAIAEEETDRMAAEWKTRAAVVLVLDPSTGEVRAMSSRASVPTTNLAWRREYVPGSTMKPFTVAAALEEGVVQPTQRFDCENGERAYGGATVLRDARKHGWLDVGGVLAVSSNIGIAKIYDELGGERLLNWAKRFRFGAAPSISGHGAATGSLPLSLEDRSMRGASVANGEGMTATPIQVAAAFAAIANGGTYHPPTLTHSSGAGERVIHEGTARAVMAMLERVVADADGTGRAARVEGVRVAGKTGTAELKPPHGPEKDPPAYYSSFVGAAPVEEPRYVVLVGAEAPRDHGTGGQVAAPAFSRIMTRALSVGR